MEAPQEPAPAASVASTMPSSTCPSTPGLDWTSYPHILERIADLADVPAALHLRAVCHELKARIDTRLLAHVVIWRTSPGGPSVVADPLGRRLHVNLRANPFALLTHTNTVDIPAWHEDVWPFLSLSSHTLVRFAGTGQLYSSCAHEVRYLDLRSDGMACDYPWPSIFIRVVAAQECTVHITLDEGWARTLSSQWRWEFVQPQLLNFRVPDEPVEGKGITLTLVLHPASGQDYPDPVVTRMYLRAFFVPVSRSIIWSFRIVGLEGCAPQLFGLPRNADLEECLRPLFKGAPYAISFVTMAEWTADTDPRVVEVPPLMAHAAAQVAGAGPPPYYERAPALTS